MDLVLDLELAQLSSAVYEPTWEGVARALPPRWHLVYPFDIGNTEAMLCRRGAEVTAAVFRGTEASRGDVADLLSNLGNMTLWDGPGSVHGGYWRYVQQVKQPLLEKAKLLAGARFFVTGHSMGGAAAQLWAGAVRRQIHIDGVVAFSPPRCMNAEAASTIEDITRCHTVQGDFVFYWPPNPWFKKVGEQHLWSPPTAGLSALACHDIDMVRMAMRG